MICLALVGLVVSCGDDPKATPNAAVAPTPIGALAPTSAQVIVQFASADAARDLAEGAGLPDPLGLLAASMGVDASHIDKSRAGAVAFTLSKDAPMPAAVFILPFKDATAAAKAHTGASATRDGYAALATSEQMPAAGSALASGLLAGDVSVRIDCKSVVEIYGELIEHGFGAFNEQMKQAAAVQNQPGMVGVLDAYATGVRNLIFGAETLDLAARRQANGTLLLDAVLTAQADGPLELASNEKSKLAELAAHLPAELPLAMAFRFDWSGYMKLWSGSFETIVAAVAEKDQAAFRSYLQRMNASMDKLGKDVVVSMGFGSNGLRIVMVMDSPQPAAYLAEYMALLADPVLGELGMQFQPVEKKKIGGVEVQRLRVTIDGERFFKAMGTQTALADMDMTVVNETINAVMGPDGLVADLVALEDRLVFVIGGDDAMTARAIAAKEVPAWFRPVLMSVPGELQFAMYCDARALTQQMSQMMRALSADGPKVAAGEPVPIAFAASIQDNRLNARLAFNLKEIQALIPR